MERVPMTPEGEQALRKELEKRKSVDRAAIANAIAEARAHGDLKENAEYHAAREQQSFNEGRVNEIEGKLSRATIIDIKQIPESGKVIFGTKVTLADSTNKETIAYRIVGEDQADIKENLISVNSPIARGLIGKEVGEQVSIQTPGGISEFEIIKVEH